MRFSIWPNSARTWAQVHELTDWAQAQNWYGVWLADHYMPNTGTTEVADGAMNECWAYLGALAATTSTLRFGPLVAPTSVHHPAILANRAATLDQISGGRFVLGLGAGWQINEHAAYGIELPDAGPRVSRFEEAIQIVRSLLDVPRTTFEGEYYRITDAPCEPHPTGPVPIVVGSAGPRMMRIVARYAQEWNCWGRPEITAERAAGFDQACEQVGRDPATVHRSTQALVVFTDGGRHEPRADSVRAISGTPEQIAERIREYAAQGFSEFIVPDFPHLETAGQRFEHYQRFAAEVVPLLA